MLAGRKVGTGATGSRQMRAERHGVRAPVSKKVLPLAHGPAACGAMCASQMW